jgi:probable F420-dependent oxidoreductase
VPLTLGRIGVWITWQELTPDLVPELERLGYGAVWIGSSPGGDLAVAEDLLAATERMVVATGIVNIWADDARAIAAAYHRLADAYPDRFLLGIGVGHREATAEYRHPYSALVEYLDALDAEAVPKDRRVVAALGPRVLKLAADRAAGAHPYLVTVEHTRQARALLGPGVLLAPEHKVVIEADPGRARAAGRSIVTPTHMGLGNYASNLRRLGYTDEDVAGAGSDRLIDALVAHGDAAAAAAGLHEHLAAGADHVALHLIPTAGRDPVDDYAALAAEFG